MSGGSARATGALAPLPGSTVKMPALRVPDDVDGRTLWVVENFANRLVKIRLAPDLSSGQVVSVLTNADVGGGFRIPTTVAEHGHRLAIVNGRFDLGLPPPLGSGVPAGTDYDVLVVHKP